MTERVLLSPYTSGQVTVRVWSMLRGRTVIDLSACCLLLGTAAVAFGPVFGGSRGYLAAGSGALVGVVVAILGRLLGWGVLSTAAAVLLGYLALGGPITVPDTVIGGVVPTLSTVRQLAQLLVNAWRDLLTVGIPADGFPGPAVVPFASGLALGTMAAAAGLRGRRVWCALAALVWLMVGILWGVKSAPLAQWQGASFAIVVLAWCLAAQPRSSSAAGDEGGVRPRAGTRQTTLGLAMIAIGVAAGMVLAPLLLGQANRDVLRDGTVPPLDPRDFASPLVQYRHLVTNLKDETLISVRGLPDGARVRLATLDAYDGIVYNVAAASSGYLKIGGRLDLAPPSGPVSRLNVEVGALNGPWLPGGGDIREVSFTGPRQKDESRSLYVNPATGTALTSAGIGSGTVYDIAVALPVVADPKHVAGEAVADVTLPVPTKVPEVVAQAAAATTEGITAPYDQLKAIERHLKESGFYSDGSDGKSRAGHSAERIDAFLGANQLIGDDEQYAVAMALMGRSLGLPVRVVLGFYPSSASGQGREALTGKDAHVWVEVPLRNGKVAEFDPTPDRDLVPKTMVPTPRERPKPQVLPPPEPPLSDVERPTDLDTSRRPPAADPGTPIWHRVLRAALIGAGATALLVAPLVLIRALKRRRRRSRRRAARAADRMSGAWAEALDHAADLGTAVPARLTRREGAQHLGVAYPFVPALALAARVDHGTFGPGEPTEADVAALWREVDALTRGMSIAAGRRRAWRAHFSLRSLSRRTKEFR